MKAPATVACSMINTTKNILAFDCAISKKNRRLYAFVDDLNADQQDVVFKKQAEIRAAHSQKENTFALA